MSMIHEKLCLTLKIMSNFIDKLCHDWQVICYGKISQNVMS